MPGESAATITAETLGDSQSEKVLTWCVVLFRSNENCRVLIVCAGRKPTSRCRLCWAMLARKRRLANTKLFLFICKIGMVYVIARLSIVCC